MASSFASSPKVVLMDSTKITLNQRFSEMLTHKQPMRVTVHSIIESHEEMHKGQEWKQQQQQQQYDQAMSSSSTGNSESSRRELFVSPNQKPAPKMERRPPVNKTLKSDFLLHYQGKSSVHSRLGWPFRSLKRSAEDWEDQFYGKESQGSPSHPSSSSHGPSHSGSSYRDSSGGEIKGSCATRPLLCINRWSHQQESPQSRSASSQMNRSSCFRRHPGWEGASGHGGKRANGRGSWETNQRFFSGGGYGQCRPTFQAPLTKEQLDNQLDDYMSKACENLNARLAYCKPHSSIKFKR